MNDYTYVKGSRTVVKKGEWQPIETASKDGTTILVYGLPEPLIIGGDVLTSFHKELAVTAAYDEIDEAFCLSGGSWMGPFIEPTHWMPLPEPPKP